MIQALSQKCSKEDNISLKLELDYKLADALNGAKKDGACRDIDEFLYFDGDRLIGYAGICSFGGPSGPLEITGMVDPEYRRRGVFSKIYEAVILECKRRGAKEILFLCDQKSAAGQKFLAKVGAIYQYSEFEMYQSGEFFLGKHSPSVKLRKAVNADALEVARQNRLYFGEGEEQEDGLDEVLLPEDEEKRGILIYLAEKEGRIIGKVHLQITGKTGGIYGLGVLPEYRGNGFGRAILLEAIEKLKALQAEEIMLQVAAENASALRLYQSCGFQTASVMDYFSLSNAV